jgi:hypothetical protein
MKKIKVIVERGEKGFSAYSIDKFDNFALFGFGDSVENTIDDFKIAYDEIKTSLDNVPELQFEFYVLYAGDGCIPPKCEGKLTEGFGIWVTNTRENNPNYRERRI